MPYTVVRDSSNWQILNKIWPAMYKDIKLHYPQLDYNSSTLDFTAFTKLSEEFFSIIVEPDYDQSKWISFTFEDESAFTMLVLKYRFSN